MSISNGTDAPVEDVSPIASYYSTVSRRLKDGSIRIGSKDLLGGDGVPNTTMAGRRKRFHASLQIKIAPAGWRYDSGIYRPPENRTAVQGQRRRLKP